MSADLHAPLGQSRKDRGARRRIPLSSLAGGLVVIGLLGLSSYSTFMPLPLTALQLTDQPETTDAASAEVAAPKPDSGSGMEASRPRSGANVERTVTDDGSVVTKYSPKARDGKGPALISAQDVGQDPRMASLPDENLLEDTPEGRIPVIGPDGLRPVDLYARPWSGARGTRIAIVVGGIGLSQTGSQKAVRELPPEVTLAFASTGNSLTRWMQEARRKGHEVLLQVPLEPMDYPANDPGRGTLLTGRPADENLKNLHEAMARMTNYTGIMNYMGGRFLADGDALEPVMRDIGKRGLLFLDDGSTARSMSGDFAKAIGMPQAYGNLLLDGQLDRRAILDKLDELERIARRSGGAIGTASAFDETILAIREWAKEASGRGIEIVGVSAFATDGE
ncbi:hypothetical protein ACO34A_21640 [Rhizobium sp. ACO-34A]|nr:divergent polysaccharide deacetylase family protein [Rhizobium sp. ACO-34A]ATN36396.1 hypothetical protein ACO34A_21640 [Rhizobium sp. ACO-34A]